MSRIDRITAMAEEMKKKKKKPNEDRIDRITTLADQLKAGDENAITNYMNDIENTIAPIKTTVGKDEEEEAWYKKILKGSEAFEDNLRRFEDGYDFGDLTMTGLENVWDTGKTAVSTGADVVTNIGKGAVKVGEGLGALLVSGVAQGYEWAGNEEKAEVLRGRVAGTLPNRFGTYGAPTSQAIEKVQEKYIDPNSISGQYADMVAESIGYSGTIGAIGSVAPALAMPTVFASSSGHAAEEVYKKDDVSGLQAWTKILGTGAVETAAESMFGLLGVGGTNFTNKITNEVLEKATSSAGKVFARLVTAGVGESVEELVSYAGNHLLDNVVVDNLGEADFSKEWNGKDLAEQMIIAFVSAGISQGTMTKAQVDTAIKETETQLGRELTSKEKAGLTQNMLQEGNSKNEQQVLDKLVEREVAAREKDGTKLARKDRNKIIKEIQDDLQKGLIDTTDIESIFGGESYTKLQEAIKRRDTIQKEIDTLDNMKNAEITVKEMKRLNSLEQRLKEIDIRALQTELDNEVFNKIGENNNFLQRSYQERAQRGKLFETTEQSENENIRNWDKSFVDAKSNNSQRAHSFNEFGRKIIQDKNIKMRAVNYETLVEEGKMKKFTDEKGNVSYKLKVNGEYRDVAVNGFKEKGVLNVNIQSGKVFEATVGHELGEFIKDSDADMYDQLKNIALELGKADGTYTEASIQKYADIYGENTDDAVDEYVNDKLGELFTNDTFVEQLSTKPNILKTIINEIKHLVKMATAGSKEQRKLVSLQHKLESKFKEAYKNSDLTKESEQNNTELNRTEQNESTTSQVSQKHSTQGLEGVKADETKGKSTKYSLTDNKGRELSKGQQEYFKDSKVRDEEGNLRVMYHGTDADFNTFSYEFYGKTGTAYGRGFYFTDSKNSAEAYGSNVKEVYLDIKKPMQIGEKTMSKNDFRNLILAVNKETNGTLLEDYGGIDEAAMEYEYGGDDIDLTNSIMMASGLKFEKFYEILKNTLGYDGIKANNITNGEDGNIYLAFNPNQIKSVDNLNPTDDPDIRYSLSEDSKGNKLNPLVQKRFEKSKARDENGKLKVLYHGTPFGEFAVFDKTKANIENDFGKGFYFTDSEIDVESNYEGGGADFETKVSRLAELIELNEGISYEEAEEKARKQLYKGDHKFEVYVNIENPAIVGETILFDRDSYAENYNIEDFESEEEYYDEIDQLVRDDIESVMWQIRQELEFFVEDDGIENVLFEAYIEGGIGVQELKDRINELYLETEEGIAGNEITRIIIEALGYDGIIDPTVSTKWDKMNMDEGTTHYIVFKRNQIKAITNENPTDHNNIHLSLSDPNEIAPRQRGLTYSEDVKIQDVVADIEKTIDDLFDRINKIYARVTVDAEDYAPVNEANLSELEQQYEENFKTIDDNIAPVEELVETNIGKIPVAEYRDMMAQQSGFDDYADMRRQGYKLGNEYDIAPITEEPIKGVTLDEKVLRDEMLGLGVAKKHNTKELKQSAEELNALISEGKTDDATLDTFVDGLGDRLLIEHDPYEYDDAVKGARDYIRTTRLYVSDEVKNGIGQWNEFRKANMGKMKLTNDPKATPVDSAYQELQELYGTTLFPDDIYNPADQLELISDLLGASKGILPIREYLESQYGTRAWAEMKESFINRIKTKVTEATRLKEVADYTEYHASIPIDDSYIPEVSQRQDIDDIVPMRNEVPEFEDVATQRRMDFENQVITDEPVSDLEKKKARALKKLGSKENFIKDKVTEFYNETKKLTKGVRASYDLSRVLDVAFKDIEKITEGMSEEDAKAERNRVWRDVTNSFMNIKAKPFETVNPNSKVEAMIRQEIDRQYNAKLQGIDDMKEVKPKKAVQEEQRELARKLIGDTSTWVDKSMGIKYRVNTLKRNLRDIIKDVNGNPDIQRADAIYEEYEGKYNKNEAKLKVEFNRIAQPFRDLKLTRAEEVYVQMLGELRHNPDTSLLPDKVEEFYEANKDKIDTGKVEIAIDNARDTYDELFNRINQTLRNQGMKELEYRKGYFPHFVEEKQGLLARLFDWKIRNEQIPTDIAGLTELNNPERSWQSFNKHREGDTTDYNFSKGFDTYVRGALDWIYHIEDIQKRRALENEIRYQHSAKGVKEKIDAIYNNTELDADEKQAQIEAVFGVARTPLNNFVTDLRTGTNILAGKKSSLDRSMEYNTNRQVYSTMTNISNRVSGNMIAGSVSSALTNFIPITQSWVEVSPLSSLNATRETIANAIKDDGTIAKSTFLTNRLIKAENLYKSNWDKAADKVGIMTDVIDSITSQVVWRAKYNENIKNGMDELEAINNADIFAENVIAGRSRGNEPTLFHSKNPLTKMFTAFQLEINNQYGYMFKDAPIDIGSRNKLIKGYATAFIGAFIYNALYSSLTGRDAAFDPIGLIADILKELGFGGDDEEEEKTAAEKFTAITEDLVQQLPFVGGLFGGGRVPLSAAIPYENPIEMVKGTGADLLNLTDGEKREKAFKDLTSEWLKPVTYLALPFGGGQISKTVKGLSMYDEDLPVAGSYTNGGDLRFTADESTTGKIKSAIFGQWASKSAQEYVDSGFKTIKKKDIDELVDLDMTSTEYRKYRKGLTDAGNKNEDKIEYINSLDVPIEHKNIMANNVLKRDYEVDMTGFTNYDEFDFSYKNPEKYEFLQANNISYEEYTTSKARKEAYDWAYENPENYVVSKVVTDDIVLYRQYKKDLDKIKADTNSEGKSISGSAKTKKLDYINNLDLSYEARIILYKTEYPSADEYNYDIINYLNNRDDISAEEMTTILKKLGMNVDNQGNISW